MGGLGVKIQHFPLTLLVVLTTLTLPCERDRVVIFGSMVWFSWSANSTMPVTFGSDIPLLPGQRKFAIFIRKSAITQLVQEIRPRFLHLLGGFRDRPV